MLSVALGCGNAQGTGVEFTTIRFPRGQYRNVSFPFFRRVPIRFRGGGQYNSQPSLVWRTADPANRVGQLFRTVRDDICLSRGQHLGAMAEAMTVMEHIQE